MTSEPENLLPEAAAINCTICGAQVAVWPEAMVCHCQTVPWKARLSSPESGTDGYVMVPREPTEAMVKAASEYCWQGEDDCRQAWRVWLSASPTPPIPMIAEAGERECVARLLCEQHGGDPDSLATEEHDCWEGPLWSAFVKDADVIIAALPTPATLDNTAVDGFRALVQEMLDNLKHCLLNSGTCHCGDGMDRHADPMSSGHTPVDMGWTVAEAWIGKAEAALVGREDAK